MRNYMKYDPNRSQANVVPMNGWGLLLQKENENIGLIDQENRGVSAARNRGIDQAEGKYLLFIDSDDYVERNSLSRSFTNPLLIEKISKRKEKKTKEKKRNIQKKALKILLTSKVKSIFSA